MSDNNITKNLAISFLIGVVSGVTLGILYAPRQGQQTREKIKERGHDTIEAAEEIIHEAQVKAENIIDQARSKAKALMHRKKEAATEVETHAQEVE